MRILRVCGCRVKFGVVVYASGMQPRTPFLFAMPPLFAWPLAFMTSIALLLALALTVAGTSEQSDAEAENTDEAGAVTREVSPAEQILYLGLLIVPVGLVPMMARRKRMNVLRWSIGAIGVGFIQLITQMIFLHPLMVLLALLFLRPLPLVAPTVAPEAHSSEGQSIEAASEATSEQPTPSARRRQPRRRRRPRF